MDSIQELRERRDSKAKEARNLHDTNTGQDKEWTEEINTQFQSLMSEIEQIDAEIKRMEDLMKIDAVSQKLIIEDADKLGISVDESTRNHGEQKKLFKAWLRGGEKGATIAPEVLANRLNIDIRATQSTTTDSEGGYLVPEGFGGEMFEELLSFGGMREAATIIRTATGNPLPWPTVDDTGNTGELVAESAAPSDQDVTYGVVTLNAWEYTSKVFIVPVALLQDSGIDLEAYIRRALAVRLGRITNEHYTTGNGTSRPYGIMQQTGVGVTGTTGQTDSVIYDDLVDLEHSIDPAYRRQGCRWMFHDTSLRNLKKLLDGEGRPIWLPSLTGGAPATILSYPYTINQDVAEMAANAKSIAFGLLSAYIIRDSRDIELFRFDDSAYMKNRTIGFMAWLRTDGDLGAATVGAAAATCVKHYANSAT